MREEIPFERFFFDRGINGAALSNSSWATFKARGVALIHTLEGIVRAVAHRIEGAVKCVLEQRFGYHFQVTSDRHYNVYQAQMTGLKYSLKAIRNPVGAIVQAFLDEKVGVEFDHMQWGTLYTGNRNFLIFGHYTDRRV